MLRVVGIFFLVLSIFTGFLGWVIAKGVREDIKIAESTASWDKAVAVVTASTVEQRKSTGKHRFTLWCTKVDYTYVVDGELRHSEGIRYLSGCHIYKNAAEARLDHYRVGAYVPVYVNPQNPDQAVLEPGVGQDLWWNLPLGLVMVGGSIFLFAYAHVLIAQSVPGAVRLFFWMILLVGGLILKESSEDAIGARWGKAENGRILTTTRNDGDAGLLGWKKWCPTVTYSYEVNGKAYTGDALRPGGACRVRRWARDLSAGAEVQVWHRFGNPSDAVLDPKASGWKYLHWLMGVVMVLVALRQAWVLARDSFGGKLSRNESPSG